MSFHFLLLIVLHVFSMFSGIWISIIKYKVSYILKLHPQTASSESHPHVFLICNILHNWIMCASIPPPCDFAYYWILLLFSERCLLCCHVIKTKNETLCILAFTIAVQYMLINISCFSLNMPFMESMCAKYFIYNIICCRYLWHLLSSYMWHWKI